VKKPFCTVGFPSFALLARFFILWAGNTPGFLAFSYSPINFFRKVSGLEA